MRLRDLAGRREADVLGRCAAWTRTQEFQRRLDEARRAIGDWLDNTDTPAISCSGGKDSTLLLLLVREQHPGCPAYRADPPNPLPDRPAHVAALEAAAGGPWVIVPYPWDVEAVLRREQPFPCGLKVRRLTEAHARDGIDGIALGIRAAESRGRRMHVALRGFRYQRRDGVRIVQPLARWSAEQVIGALLAADRLPLNPVYRRISSAASNLEHVRDGTWWPTGTPRTTLAQLDQRSWIATHYPDVLPLYDRAVAAWGYGCGPLHRRAPGDDGAHVLAGEAHRRG